MNQNFGPLESPVALKQKSAIDEWMYLIGAKILSTQEVVGLMGGMGDDRCKTIEDCLSKPNSNPGKWFSSNQTDTSFYTHPHYVYDNWFVSHVVSRQTYGRAGCSSYGDTVLDLGGTIFSGIQMLSLGTSRVIATNIPSYATDFMLWYQNKLGIPDTEFEVYYYDYAGNKNSIDWIVASEYFEHFSDVDAEFAKHVHCSNMIVSNAFCVAAHGHYNPITINDQAFLSNNGPVDSIRSAADQAFEELASSFGYKVENISFSSKKILHLER
jgi:hypothetical protein